MAGISDLFHAAVTHHQYGRIREAEQVCRQLLQADPQHVDGWYLLGLVAHQEQHLDHAIAHYHQVLILRPNHYQACNNLAVALQIQGKMDEAIAHYKRALAIQPDYSDAHNNYANVLREKGQIAAAIHHYRQAIASKPNYADAYNNLGLLLYTQEDYAGAADQYRQAVSLCPTFAQAHNHLGNALKELGNLEDAAFHFQQAIALKPNYAKAFNNLGNIYRDRGELQTALTHYEQAIAIEPEFAEAHWNKALTLLFSGNLEQGFAEYEWRWRVHRPTFQPMRLFSHPRWDGSPLNGKTIFLHAEQGMGDILQFIRYVPLVARQGGRIIVECHPPLLRLLRYMPEIQHLIPYGSTPPKFDFHAPLLSLPYIFGTTLDNIPNQVPYLVGEWELQCAASQCHKGTESSEDDSIGNCAHLAIPEFSQSDVHLGIVWSGNPQNPYNRARACPLSNLLCLASVPGVTVYSLQKDITPGDLEQLQAHPEIRDLRHYFHDFVDTAALIMQLDLVITVDTAVAHLAGALGKPVWLLLPFTPDWRWMLHRDDSPWYPTMRLFRQNQPGDWDSVILQIREALAVHVGQKYGEVKDAPFQADGFDAPQPTTTQIAISWQLDELSDRGIYGLNLVLHLQTHPQVQPRLLHSPDLVSQDAVYRALLQSMPTSQSIDKQLSRGSVVLHWLETRGAIAPDPVAWQGTRSVGLVFARDTNLDAPTIAIAKACGLLIVGSTWSASLLKRYGLEPVQIIAPGIDPALFHPAPKVNPFGDRMVIFSGGSLDYSGGQDIIIIAFKHFHSRHPDTLLLTAWTRSECDRWANWNHRIEPPRISLDGRVEIAPWLLANGLPDGCFMDLGSVPYAQLGQILQQADVAVFPNRCIADPNRLAMASLACGCSTILSANTGHLDLLRHNLGYPLYAQRPIHGSSAFGTDGWGETDVEEVVETLEWIYTNRQEASYRSSAAIEFLREWTWETYVQHFLQAIATI